MVKSRKLIAISLVAILAIAIGATALISLQGESAGTYWKECPAVKNNNIFYLQGQGENIFNRQSVRTVDAIQMMAQILHPDLYDTKVPHDPIGGTPNIIGDDYAEYLPPRSEHKIYEIGEVLESKDASGKTIKLEKSPERIVSCTPGLTEMIYALGLGDRLVAVTDYCDYPEEILDRVGANDIKKIGGFWDPNYEMIIDASPDLVLVDYGTNEHKQLADKLSDAGVPVVQMFEQEDLASVYDNLELLGKITGTSDTANEIIGTTKDTIAQIKDAVSEKEVPTVLYVTYVEERFTNAYVSGGGTAVDELIRLAGGNNIFGDESSWFAPSSELLIDNVKNIDYMIITSMYSPTAAEELNNFLRSEPVMNNDPSAMNDSTLCLQAQIENMFNYQSIMAVDAIQNIAKTTHSALSDTSMLDTSSEAAININDNRHVGDSYLGTRCVKESS
ncbi:MAG: ABC transporter substrate-binding protein [Euryarchaeota archaeon]|nr:ABC transporter substrate-binding protein [Euryarchaeota archaeon]